MLPLILLLACDPAEPEVDHPAPPAPVEHPREYVGSTATAELAAGPATLEAWPVREGEGWGLRLELTQAELPSSLALDRVRVHGASGLRDVPSTAQAADPQVIDTALRAGWPVRESQAAVAGDRVELVVGLPAGDASTPAFAVRMQVADVEATPRVEVAPLPRQAVGAAEVAVHTPLVPDQGWTVEVAVSPAEPPLVPCGQEPAPWHALGGILAPGDAGSWVLSDGASSVTVQVSVGHDSRPPSVELTPGGDCAP